jgi:hypothetical protein
VEDIVKGLSKMVREFSSKWRTAESGKSASWNCVGRRYRVEGSAVRASGGYRQGAEQDGPGIQLKMANRRIGKIGKLENGKDCVGRRYCVEGSAGK